MHPYFPFLIHSHFPKIEHICFPVTVRAQVCRTECELWVDCTGNGIPETYCGEMVVIACNTQAPEFMWTWCTASVTVTPPLMLSGGSRSGGYNCCPS